MPEDQYRLFRRVNGIYYRQDNAGGQQISLGTRDKKVAQEKLRAANQAFAQPRLNLDLARVYLRAHDAQITERTWAEVMAPQLYGLRIPGSSRHGG